MSFFESVLPLKSTGHTPLIRIGPSGGLTRFQWFKWPDEKDKMEAFVEEYAAEDVYFSPFLYSKPPTRRNTRWASKEHVTSARAIWADGDNCPRDEVKIPPTVLIQSSEGHWQGLWVPEDGEEVDPRTLEDLSRALYDAHADDGMDRGWPLAKKLRVPGTTNTKYGQPWTPTVEYSDTPLTVGEFAAVYEPTPRVEVEDEEYPVDLPSPFDVLGRVNQTYVTNAWFLKTEQLPIDPATGKPNRSGAMYSLQCMLLEHGCTLPEVFAVVRTAEYNKYEQDGRSDAALWKQVVADKARWENEHLLESTRNDGDNTPLTGELMPMTAGRGGEFSGFTGLYPDEVEPTDTIVDAFSVWASNKSKMSPRQFHVCGALSLLSALFAKYAKLTLSFGDVPLNLYFLVLGRTTQSRKSTSLRLSQKIVYQITEGEPDKYLVPDDATPEALVQFLGTKPFESSLYSVDEVQDLFASANRKGSYMAAIIGFLTKAYDGQLPGVLRKTGEQNYQKSTPHYMSFYGTGILSVAAKYLTAEKIETGFVPRCLIAVDDKVGFTPGAEDLVFLGSNTRDNKQLLDAGEELVISQLTELLERYENEYKKRDELRLMYEDPRISMDCEPEAFERWKQFVMDATTRASEHKIYSRELFPLVDRMSMSTLKIAGLLALSEGKDMIAMRHMLKAISFAGIWMPSSEIFVNEISSSGFARMVDDIILWVANAPEGKVPYTKLLAHFQSKFNSGRELTEALSFAQRRGMLSEEVTDRDMNARVIKFTGVIKKEGE